MANSILHKFWYILTFELSIFHWLVKVQKLDLHSLQINNISLINTKPLVQQLTLIVGAACCRDFIYGATTTISIQPLSSKILDASRSYENFSDLKEWISVLFHLWFVFFYNSNFVRAFNGQKEWRGLIFAAFCSLYLVLEQGALVSVPSTILAMRFLQPY